MKKFISTLFVAVALMFAGVQSAQAQFGWGVKGGLNLQKADFDKSDLKSDNFTGFFIGPMAEFTIPVIGLGVDAALLYSQTGIKEEDETLKCHSLEIPINLKYSIGLGSIASVYAAAGPQFAIALSQDKYKFRDFATVTPFKESQLSLNLGVGVKLLSHLQAGVTYNIPLGDTADFEYTDATGVAQDLFTAKNKTWKIHVAYIF